jgi:hypothetical protein
MLAPVDGPAKQATACVLHWTHGSPHAPMLLVAVQPDATVMFQLSAVQPFTE